MELGDFIAMTARRKGRTRRWAALLASLICGFLISAGAAARTEVRLTEVLARAEACGPAFESLARAYDQQRLADRKELYDKLPSGRVTLAARLDPAPRQGGRATVGWQLTDDLSVDLNVPLGTLPIAGTPGASGGSLSVSWSKRLWPDPGRAFRDELQRVEEHITALELREQEASAITDVVAAFYALRAAEAQLELDARQHDLAQGRADYALQRYEQGFIGLRDLQTEQSALHQAAAAVERSWREARQARERLVTVIGAAESGSECAYSWPGEADLVDDVDWEAVIGEIAGLLELPAFPQPAGADEPEAEPADAWEDLLLAHSIAYQRARMAVLNARIALAAAESALLPALNAEAVVQTDLEAFDPGWAVGVSVTWDFAAARRLDVESARLELEAAESRLEQARRTAVDAGRTAWRRVVDATSALSRTEEALEEARRTEELALRRIDAGLAPEAERKEARLVVDRRRAEVEAARAERHMAWLALAQQFGIAIEVK